MAKRGRKPKPPLRPGQLFVRPLARAAVAAVPASFDQALERGEVTPARAAKRALQVRRFVRHFVAGPPGVAGSATQAAIAAGLGGTRHSCRIAGNLMVRDPAVIRAIERQLEAIDATTARIVEELGRVAFADGRELDEVRRLVEAGEPLDGVPDHVASAMSAVTRTVTAEGGESVRVQQHDKIGALGLLAKIRRMVSPGTLRVEHAGADGGPIQHQHAVVVYLPENGRDARPAPVAVGSAATANARVAALPATSPAVIDIDVAGAESVRRLEGAAVRAPAPGPAGSGDSEPGSTPGAPAT